jgi:hypothetical protein
MDDLDDLNARFKKLMDFKSSDTSDDLDESNILQAQKVGVALSKDGVVAMQRDRSCTWKVAFKSGDLRLRWSVSEDLVDSGINAVDEFKIKTLGKKHKQSMMSSRKGFKYSAPIANWYTSKAKEFIFELAPVMHEGCKTVFRIAVFHENCDFDRFHLEKQLTSYTNKLWQVANPVTAIKQGTANTKFAKALFNTK